MVIRAYCLGREINGFKGEEEYPHRGGNPKKLCQVFQRLSLFSNVMGPALCKARRFVPVMDEFCIMIVTEHQADRRA